MCGQQEKGGGRCLNNTVIIIIMVDIEMRDATRGSGIVQLF
jgi:hypothetical protein